MSDAEFSFVVEEQQAGQRLDRLLVSLLPEYSRSRLQRWIREGEVQLNDAAVIPRHVVKAGDRILLSQPPAVGDPAIKVQPENIPLDIHYEDESLLVIRKPAGLVMHIAPGNYTGTLQNGLLHYDQNLQAVPRAGIVHRLDKDTSGLIVVARSLAAHNALVQQLQNRSVHRIYDAVVKGIPVSGDTVDQPIGRHPVDRKRMSVSESGKTAITHFRIQRKYTHHCHLRLQLETGRTHQIRVHMAHLRFPLIGDPVYGGRKGFASGLSDQLNNAINNFPRQALHASELGLIHPATGQEILWKSELPEDFRQLLNALDTG